MKSQQQFLATFATFFAVGLSVSLSRAADPQLVNDWDNSGLPGDVSMYSYVPASVSENPPIVVVIHYCGGTGPDVFGQARDGGLVTAADDYGFLIILPSSKRCWDVVSDKTRTRGGQGDSHAIRTMVSYAIDKLGGNPDRVYATGDSSGGMMTELLLGLYPDVFKAGSAMAGMPAGCRGDNENGNGGGYSGACAGGNVDRTPEAWGQVVESLSPGFMGMRPRVQLFHGDADGIISFKNHTEAIDEWTFVHELTTTPTSTTDVTLGTHNGTRQTWEGDCGLPLVDAFTSKDGDHGPGDALFLANYLVPFLGLDDTGDVDPHVAACGDTQGTGGAGSGGAGSAADGGSGAGGDTILGAGGVMMAAAGGAASVGTSGSFGAGGADSLATGGNAVVSGSGASAPGSEMTTGGDMAEGSASEKGGCSVVGLGGVGGSGAALFSFLGLVLSRVRRRTRR